MHAWPWVNAEVHAWPWGNAEVHAWPWGNAAFGSAAAPREVASFCCKKITCVLVDRWCEERGGEEKAEERGGEEEAEREVDRGKTAKCD